MEKILRHINKLSDKLFEHRIKIFKIRNLIIFLMGVHLLISLYGTYQSGYCVNCTELTIPELQWGQDPLVIQEGMEQFNTQKIYRPFTSTKEYLISFSLTYFSTLLYFIVVITLTYTIIRFIGLVVVKLFFGDRTPIKRIWEIFKGVKKQ